jgi:PX domain
VLQTIPHNWVVKRTREDFKWLTKSLKDEYPKKMIDRISEGEMNQKSIEKFLQTLVEDSEILNCKHFIFFLRADEEAFKKKSSSDFDWVKNLANKFSQNNEFHIKELGLELKEN